VRITDLFVKKENAGNTDKATAQDGAPKANYTGIKCIISLLLHQTSKLLKLLGRNCMKVRE